MSEARLNIIENSSGRVLSRTAVGTCKSAESIDTIASVFRRLRSIRHIARSAFFVTRGNGMQLRQCQQRGMTIADMMPAMVERSLPALDCSFVSRISVVEGGGCPVLAVSVNRAEYLSICHVSMYSVPSVVMRKPGELGRTDR